MNDQVKTLDEKMSEQSVNISDIFINEELNVRKSVRGYTDEDKQQFENLKQNIKDEGGLLQKFSLIKVEPNTDNNSPEFNDGKNYIVAWGFRRATAIVELHKEGKWHSDVISANIVAVSDDEELSRLQLMENLFRAEVNPIDLSDVFRDLCVDGDVTQSDLSESLKVSQPWVSQIISLGKLPGQVKDMMRDGTLGLRAGRAIVKEVVKVAPERALECAEKSLGMTSEEFESWLSSEFAPAPEESCLLYTSPSPRDRTRSRMPSSA